ncbi:MAG: hypothetical protein ACLTDM_20995 [Clostridium butyricum]
MGKEMHVKNINRLIEIKEELIKITKEIEEIELDTNKSIEGVLMQGLYQSIESLKIIVATK